MALLRRLSFIMILMSFIGCGGGDGGLGTGNTGGGSGTPDPITISLAISDTNVTEQAPVTVTATVMQGSSAYANQLVTFTLDNDQLGSFTPSTGTANTDANGEASVVLNAGDIAGAGEITASLSSGETATITFTSQGVSDVVVRLGSGNPFSEGVAAVSLAQISAGGTTVVEVALVDEQGAFYTESVELNFTSVCAEEAVPSATLSSPVTTSNGQATSTYLAKGCVGDDPITVSTVVNGVSLQATAVVNVLPADVGSIEFVSATPETIGIVGTGAVGGSESSTIVFKVLDTNGNPVNNQDVSFELSTATGGILLNPGTATTNNEGLVQTVVNSGTVATSVRVTATVDGSSPVISSQSSVLVISTGIPDQDSFSLSADILNPEAWSIDGNEVTVTARLADAFNNPVPDGTAVNFTTEGGSIEPSCTTVGGECSVKWKSQLPRPEGETLTNAACISTTDDNGANQCAETINTLGQKYGGRVTVLATAIGEESFPDLNGNGRFDESEYSAFLGTDVSGRPFDLKEAFVDHNEDGFYNPGEAGGDNTNNSGSLEEFVDFDDNGSFNQADTLYNGVLCSEPAHSGCASGVNGELKSANVRDSIVLVMSGSHPFFTTTLPEAGAAIEIAGEGTASAAVTIADLHNQPMPYGTTVEFTSTVGSVVAGASTTWGNDNHNGGTSFGVTVKGENEPKSGDLIVTVTTPSGVATSYTVAAININ